MTNLSNDQIMDYLDGALSPQETARIETHLETNAHDREIVEELRFATQSLQEFDREEWGSEPLRVGDNFWPELREKLGPAPKRSFFRQLVKSFNGVASTKPAARFSLGAAMAAIVVTLGILFLAPQGSVNNANAGNALSASDNTFIQHSVQQHQSYVATAPVAGDVSALDTGDDEGDDDVNPQ